MRALGAAVVRELKRALCARGLGEYTFRISQFGVHTVLKIDAEGAELLVLRGAGDLLASQRAPRLIFLEVHPKFLPSFGATAEAVDQLVSQHAYDVTVRRLRGDQVHLLLTRRAIR